MEWAEDLPAVRHWKLVGLGAIRRKKKKKEKGYIKKERWVGGWVACFLVERGGGLPGTATATATATAGVLVLDFHIGRTRHAWGGGRERERVGKAARDSWLWICVRGGGERERETFAADCRFFCCSSA
jgi:hypothetical protein